MSSPALVSFQSSSNRSYTLWHTPYLPSPDWTVVPGQQAIPGTGGALTLGNTEESPKQFYWAQVSLP